MPVPGEKGGGNRWAIDHLFLDQDAIPTFVEVKRSSDSRARREVVGQMADYVAHATANWPSDVMRNQFEEACSRNERDPDALVSTILEERKANIDRFWATAHSNLRSGRVRLVFVSDAIPIELQRVISYLDQQMERAEVLGIEIPQFRTEDVTVVMPRVVSAAEPEAEPRRLRIPGFRRK